VLHRLDCRPKNRILDVLLSADGKRAACKLHDHVTEVHDLERGTKSRIVRNTGHTTSFVRGVTDDEVLWLDSKTGAVGSLRMSGPTHVVESHAVESPSFEDMQSGKVHRVYERCPLVLDRQAGLVIRGTKQGWMSMAWPSRETRVERVDATDREDKTTALMVRPGSGEVIRATETGRISFDPLDGGASRLAFTGHAGTVYALAMHPAGRLLASGGKDGVIRLWDYATGEELLTLTGHLDYVHDLAFTPDGTTLVSGSGDGTARLWSSELLRDRFRAARAGR
jgi:WD40 repeat protein